MDAFLKYIGVKRVREKLEEERIQVFFYDRMKDINEGRPKGNRYQGRVRIRRYKIMGMRMRILITFCRLFKINPRGKMHPNNIIPDPLNLLDWDKRLESIPATWDPWHGSYPNQFVYRFWAPDEKYYDEDWSNTVKQIWGRPIPNQLYVMTNDSNILSRFDYWKPMVTSSKYLEDLPSDYTCNPVKFNY
jgi:hypothetical protein